jgi:hypothetical protein
MGHSWFSPSEAGLNPRRTQTTCLDHRAVFWALELTLMKAERSMGSLKRHWAHLLEIVLCWRARAAPEASRGEGKDESFERGAARGADAADRDA